MTHKGWAAPLTAVDASRDGRRLVIADGERLSVMDSKAQGVARIYEERGARLRAVAITPDGAQVLGAREGQSITAIDPQTRQTLRAFAPQPGVVTQLGLTPDGRLAVAGGSDRRVRIYEMASGRALTVCEGHAEAVSALAISADGRLAASGALDGSVRVWEIASGRALQVLESGRGRVNALAFSRVGRRLASGGEDGVVRLWDCATGRVEREWRGHVQAVNTLYFCADRDVLISGGHDRSVRFLDLAADRLLAVVRLPSAAIAICHGCSADQITAAQGLLLGVLRVPRAPRLPPLAIARPASIAEVTQHEARFEAVLETARGAMRQGQFAQAAEQLTAARRIPGFERAPALLALWDEITVRLPRKGLIAAWETARLEGHSDPVLTVAVSPDGGQIASGGMDGTLRLWDRASQQCLSIFRGHEEAVTSVAFTPDGRFAVSASWDGILRVWDIDKKECALALDGEVGSLSTVAITPDGRQLAAAGQDGVIQIWDLKAQRIAKTFKGHIGEVAHLAYSPDGRFLASAGRDKTVRLWDVAAGRTARHIDLTAAALAATFTPTGNDLVIGCADRAVHVWHLDWEVDTRARPVGSDKARPYLETFVSLRLKAQTTRRTAPSAMGFSNEEVDAAMRDLERHGVGQIDRNTVAGQLRNLALRAPQERGFWDEVRTVAKPPRTQPPAQARAQKMRRIGRENKAGVLKAPDLIAVSEYGNDCADGDAFYYLERALARATSAPELYCLARTNDPALASAFLDRLDLADDDNLRAYTRERNAASLIAAMGSAAVPAACQALGAERLEVRRVAATALKRMRQAAALDCLRLKMQSGNATEKASATTALPWLLASEQMSVDEGWQLLNTLLTAPEPEARVKALEVLPLIGFEFAEPLAQRAQTDSDDRVREAARGAMGGIASAKRWERMHGK
ncbi:MAG: hypothetical protein MUF51_11035 [Vicinamibacteria bacterium]|nr:hypothetical protein [Vicinamibacteria bacterium]